MSHERSITIGVGESGKEKYVNIKSSGYKSEDEAVGAYHAGINPPLTGEHDTLDEALSAARKRSDDHGRTHGAAKDDLSSEK